MRCGGAYCVGLGFGVVTFRPSLQGRGGCAVAEHIAANKRQPHTRAGPTLPRVWVVQALLCILGFYDCS